MSPSSKRMRPANATAPRDPTDPIDYYRLLHEHLWNKGFEKVLVKKEIQVPPTPSPVCEEIPTLPEFPPRAEWEKIEVEFVDHMQIPALAEITDAKYLLPCGMTDFMVLGDYKTLYEITGARNENYKALSKLKRIPIGESTSRHLVLIGNPGIGKSFFLSYALTRRICEGAPTVFCDDMSDGQYYRFDETGVALTNVKESDPLARNPDVWALYNSTPAQRLWSRARNWIIVQASSPQTEKYKEWSKQANAQLYFLDLWSWREIASNSLWTGASDKTLKELSTAFARYGGVARILFHTLYRPQQEWADSVGDYEKRISQQAMALVNRYPEAAAKNLFKEQVSHAVVAIRPSSSPDSLTGKRPIHPSWAIEIPTPYLSYRVARTALEEKATATRLIYEQLARVKLLRTAAGYIFESMVHDILGGGRDFKASVLGSKTCTWSPPSTLCITANERFTNLALLGQSLRARSGSKEFQRRYLGTYLRPKVSNLESVDSILVVENSSNLLPVFFQITISDSHPVNAEGLESIWKALPDEAKRDGHAFLIFVVPDDQKGFEKEQKLVGPPSLVKEWNHRLAQGIMFIPISSFQG